MGEERFLDLKIRVVIHMEAMGISETEVRLIVEKIVKQLEIEVMPVRLKRMRLTVENHLGCLLISSRLLMLLRKLISNCISSVLSIVRK